LSGLAAQLFKSIDANSDGKLNKDEFQSFLQNLMGSMGQAGGIGSASTAVASETPAAPRVYQPMIGFDYKKLNTPEHTTPKYVFARATQDIEMPWDRASRSANLQKVADYAKTHGYPNTTVIGDDTMDFGDGMGEIDVLTGDGQWWWGPKG
jgi:hypothetical protein